MTTGAFWDMTNPHKPWGWFDPAAELDIPFDWATWLAGISATYASHTITCEAPLECTQSPQAAGVIMARVRVTPAGTPVVGQKYGVTCHVVASDGQEDERTVFLKIKER